MIDGGAFDLVVQVRPHRLLGPLEYRRLLVSLVGRARAELAKRGGAGDVQT